MPGSKPQRWIAHLDMDAFYASVELLRYPDLRGRPVVVGGRRAHQPVVNDDGSRTYSVLRDYVGRGVITTSTYEARAVGVKSAMGLMKAAALAPDAVLLPADFDQYRHFSRLFKSAVAHIAPNIEDRGIDEIYIDLTDVLGMPDSDDAANTVREASPAYEAGAAHDDAALSRVRAVAQSIKDAVREATGLSCSVGITPNKLLSKLCSELDKPDGLTILTFADIPTRIWPLPARSINGIGPKAAARLEAIGIRTIGDLAAFDPLRLVDEFGSNYGAWMHNAAHGRDERGVVTHSEPKSISRETTFERDLHPRGDREALGAILTRLCEQLSADLVRKRYYTRTVGVKLRFDDFKIVTRVLTLPAHTRDARDIRLWAGRCLKKVALERRLRLIGVRADNLCREDALPAAPAPGASETDADQMALPLFAAAPDARDGQHS
jgi:DNA polymerase-4